MRSQQVMSHENRRLLSYRSSVRPRTVTPAAAPVPGHASAVEQPPPAPAIAVSDRPRPYGSGGTFQLNLANNTVDRNQMTTSSNRVHTDYVSNKEHGRHNPPCGESYSPHGTVTSPTAHQDSKAEENGSTRPKRKTKPNRAFDPAAQLARDATAVEQAPPAPDGAHPDGSGGTLQLNLANNTVDRNQMTTSSNRVHTDCVINREHGRHNPPCGESSSYSPHGTVTSPGASEDSKAEENGSTRPKRKAKPNRGFDPAAQVARDARAAEQAPPAPDGPRPDGSGGTLQLNLASSTADRNQMTTSSNRVHTDCVSNREHGRHNPPYGGSYSPHGTVTSQENGST